MEQFLQVTGASEEAAHFFLESTNGDVAAAIDQYFASGGQFDLAQANEAAAGTAVDTELHTPAGGAPPAAGEH